MDDDDLLRRLLVDYFREQALTVDWARDGAEALHLLSTRPYACIVLDVIMPHMSGIDLRASIQTLLGDPTSKLKVAPAVFVITSAPQEEVPSAAIAERFPTLVRGVFRKPLQLEPLAEAVAAALSR